MSLAERSGVLASLVAAGLASGVALGACAAMPSAAAPHELRVLVRLVQPSTDAAAISAAAARHAEVPVTYAAAISPTWHALSLRCDQPGQCEAALERLRGASTAYAAVDLDGRREKTTP